MNSKSSPLIVVQSVRYRKVSFDTKPLSSARFLICNKMYKLQSVSGQFTTLSSIFHTLPKSSNEVVAVNLQPSLTVLPWFDEFNSTIHLLTDEQFLLDKKKGK